MDERLDYSSEEQLRRSSSLTSDWMTGRTIASAPTLEVDPSTFYLQYKNYHLNLIQKKEYHSERSIIPALKYQRLSYYRNYACSPNKTEIVCKTTNSFNSAQKSNAWTDIFLNQNPIWQLPAAIRTNHYPYYFYRMFWNYIINVFLKILPHMYVQVFLASYAPEEHLFLPKMIPFFYGFKFAFIMTSISEFLINIDNSIFALGYFIHGLVHKNPWNRCTGDFNYNGSNVSCYTLDEFVAKIKNSSWTYSKHFYASEGKLFHLVQIEYFRYFLQHVLTINMRIIYFMVIWSVTVLGHRTVLTKLFWQTINAVQSFVLILEFIAFLYLLNSYFDETYIPETPSDFSDKLSKADIDLLAESTTSPPVVHVLTSRSTQVIEPRRDSCFICLSNAATYIFRFILITRLRNHCNFLAGTQIKRTLFDQYSWFYSWPLFFSTFHLGDLFTLGFLFLRVTIDTLSLLVTYHCYMEVIICEWKWIKNWMVALFTTTICVFVEVYLTDSTHALININCKGIATLCEIFAMYYLYPEGRLVDDVKFHTGNRVTKLKLLCLRFMPVFYFVKFYSIMDTLVTVMTSRNLKKYGHLHWSWTLALVPYIIGMIYISYKYTLRDKVGWERMFVPAADWGPRDQNTRRLRKEYDSRYFIRSQAMRELSRYIMEKSEGKAFQLDLNYDPLRLTTITTSKYRLDNEKKDL